MSIRSSDLFFSWTQIQIHLQLKERSFCSTSVKGNISFLQKLQSKLSTLTCFWHFSWKTYLHWKHSSPLLGWLFFFERSIYQLISDTLIFLVVLQKTFEFLWNLKWYMKCYFHHNPKKKNGSLLLHKILNVSFWRKEHLCNHLLQQSQKMLS